MNNEEKIKILKIQLKKKTEQYKEALEYVSVLDKLEVWLGERIKNINSTNEFDRYEKLLCMDILSKIKRLKENVVMGGISK